MSHMVYGYVRVSTKEQCRYRRKNLCLEDLRTRFGRRGKLYPAAASVLFQSGIS